MAQKRMFDKTIIDSDAFLDMPLSSQALYFHLSMRADDDGFVNNPKRIQQLIGAADDDLTILKAKAFIISFESGVIVIKHWRINNYIRNDRYKPTVYSEEKELLNIKNNGSYSLGIPDGNQWYTQYSIDKNSIDKNRVEEDIYIYYQKNINSLSSRQYEILNSYLEDFNEEIIKEAINRASDNNAKSFKYIEAILKSWKSKGYKTIGDVKNETKKKSSKTPEWIDKPIEKNETWDKETRERKLKEYGFI